MGRKSSWDFDEDFIVPIEWDIDNDDIIVGGKSVPDSLLPFAKKHITPENEEMVVEANCVGYNDEGCRYGDPDDCYAPESDDERNILSITFPDEFLLRGGQTEADAHYFNQWADHVQSYIDSAELDTRSCEPDYEED